MNTQDRKRTHISKTVGGHIGTEEERRKFDQSVEELYSSLNAEALEHGEVIASTFQSCQGFCVFNAPYQTVTVVAHVISREDLERASRQQSIINGGGFSRGRN